MLPASAVQVWKPVSVTRSSPGSNQVNRHSFYTWFKPTSLVRWESISIRCPINSSRIGWPSTTRWSCRRRLPCPPPRHFLLPPRGVGRGGAPWPREGVRPPPPPSGPRVGSLNERYTFDTLSSGRRTSSPTRLPAVAERRRAPTTRYSSTAELGRAKTHLMHAIGRYVLQHDPSSSSPTSRPSVS